MEVNYFNHNHSLALNFKLRLKLFFETRYKNTFETCWLYIRNIMCSTFEKAFNIKLLYIRKYI